MPPPKFNLKIQVSFFSWSLTIFILSHLTMTQWPKAKKRSCQASFQELPGPTLHGLPPMESQPDVCIMAPLSFIGKEQGQREAVAGNTCPTLPLPGGLSSVWPFGAHLMQTRFPGRWWSRKCQLHLPFHFLFPQIYGASLLSHHVIALCHSSPCIQTSQTI